MGKRNKKSAQPINASSNTYEGIDPELVKIVKKAARKAIGKSGFTKSDLPDIEQELMLAALEALKCLRESVEDERDWLEFDLPSMSCAVFDTTRLPEMELHPFKFTKQSWRELSCAK